jgi:hypothetical protein
MYVINRDYVYEMPVDIKGKQSGQINVFQATKHPSTLSLQCTVLLHTLVPEAIHLGVDSFGIGRHFHCQILALQPP